MELYDVRERALSCVYLIYIALLRLGHGVVLDRVRNVMVDIRRPLDYPPGPVRAMYASFDNNHTAYIQLWRNASAVNTWYLDWQLPVTPQYGNGSIEVINIPPSLQITLHPEHRLGLFNSQVPGPLKGVHNVEGGLILSLNTPNKTLSLNVKVTFDDLTLPYWIPVFLCNRTDCPDELVRPTLPSTSTLMTPTLAPVRSTEGVFLSDKMILGLIIWNIILSLLILILLLSLICICVDLDRKRKVSSRIYPRISYYFPRGWYDAIRRETEAETITQISNTKSADTYTQSDDVTHHVNTSGTSRQKSRYEEADKAWEYVDVHNMYM